jgi:hypothetical protein
MSTRVTVPANGVSTPFVGQQFEFIPEHAEIEISLVAAATGVLSTIFIHNELVQQEGQVSIKAANVAPVYPDDYHLKFDAAARDRLLVSLRNTTGAAIDVFAYAIINPHV